MFNGRWRPAWLGRGRDPLDAAFGHLEREVMDVLWRTGAVSVRTVQAQLPRPAAYTTVMTTLDRLFKKGFVVRRRTGRAFVYRAPHTRQQTEAVVASGLVSGLFSRGAAVPILSNLVDAVGSQDGGADLLDALEEMVRDKRRRMEEQSVSAPPPKENRKG